MKEQTNFWVNPITEEIICTLWCIVSVLAVIAGIKWLAWVTGIKAVSNLLCSLFLSIKTLRRKDNK